MPDREKVIRELRGLSDSMRKNQCYACSHEFVEIAEDFGTNIIEDALTLLKEQEETIYKLQKELNYWQNKGRSVK